MKKARKYIDLSSSLIPIKINKIFLTTIILSLSISFLYAKVKTKNLSLSYSINQEIVHELQDIYERYFPLVNQSYQIKPGFGVRSKLSKRTLAGLLEWILPYREGKTVILSKGTSPIVMNSLDVLPEKKISTLISGHKGNIIVIGEPIEEERSDSIQDLGKKLSNNKGLEEWFQLQSSSVYKKTLLVPFADYKRGHWVLLSITHNNGKTSLQFIDSKRNVPVLQEIPKRAQKFLYNVVAAKNKKYGFKRPIILPPAYLKSQSMFDRTSCGFQVMAMILQETKHSLMRNSLITKNENPPLVIAIEIMGPEKIKLDYTYPEAMKYSVKSFLENLKLKMKSGNFDYDTDSFLMSDDEDDFFE